MGAEQSSHHQHEPGSSRQAGGGAIPRSKSGPAAQQGDESGRSSPHPSVGSDADIPYVSYTVNKPIGGTFQSLFVKFQRGLDLLFDFQTLQRSKGVPSEGMAGARRLPTPLPSQSKDEMWLLSHRSLPSTMERRTVTSSCCRCEPVAIILKSLYLFPFFSQRIPLFLPIIRSSLSTTHPREPDIVDRLDSAALQRMVNLVEEMMRQNSESVAGEQAHLVQRIKEVDAQLTAIMSALTERQKMYARYADKLSRVHEVSHALSRTQLALTTALDSIETLNRQLPPAERLEPLTIWSTG